LVEISDLKIVSE